MNVKRERTELSTTLKGLKRLEIQSLCKASAGGSKMRRLADEQHPRRTTSKALPEQGAYWKSVWWNTSLPSGPKDRCQCLGERADHVTSHAGRVVNLEKCDKAARGNCNTARPLLPQKKSHSETSGWLPPRFWIEADDVYSPAGKRNSSSDCRGVKADADSPRTPSKCGRSISQTDVTRRH